MPDSGLKTLKMRAYMEALSPAARLMLMRAMRSAQERGEGNVSTDAILKAVADLEGSAKDASSDARPPKDNTPPVPWEEQIRQAFFAPVHPFVNDLAYAQKIPARLQRRSLEGIWTWLCRDLAPDDFARAFALSVSDHLPDPAAVARKLRRELTPGIAERLQNFDVNSKDMRRLGAQLGSEMALHDLVDLVYIFQKEGGFLNLTGQLPKTIASLDLAQTGPISEIVKKSIDGLQIDPGYVAVLLMLRTNAAANVAALAALLANTNDPRGIYASPYAKIVDAVISEADFLVHTFEHHLGNRSERAKTLIDLRSYHDLVRQLEVSLRPEQVPQWHRRIGAARKAMSDLIAKEIEPVAGVIRRALRVESMAGGFGGQFDPATLEDAEFGVRLAVEARNVLDSLALNEMVTKLRRQIEQTLEVILSKLLTDYRSGGAFDRTDLLKAIDGGIRMSAVVFGDEYAALLRRSRDLAVNKPQARATGS